MRWNLKRVIWESEVRPGTLAGDELREFVNVVPARGLLLERDNEVARLLLRLFEGIHEDEMAFGDGSSVEFLFVSVIGADGVDVDACRENRCDGERAAGMW